MKNIDEIKEVLYKHHKEAYESVKPGQAYPQWDTSAEWLYKGIKELLNQQASDLIQKNRWVPQIGETYFYVNDQFECVSTVYTHRELDFPRFKANNCFQHVWQCELVLDKLKKFVL